MIYIFFFYGLAFFTLGAAILFYPKENSRFDLAKTLSLIALFGICHGANEWVDMFKLIQNQADITSLSFVGLILLPVSYLFLFFFGAKSLSQFNKKYSVLNILPIFLFIVWAIITSLSTQHFLTGNIWARYLLGIPGTFLTSYALFLYLPYFRKHISSITLNMKIAAIAFVFYGIFSGIVVPHADFFPASLINDTVFINILGIPIQVFRAICAIVLAYSMVSMLRIFNWESGELHKEIAKRKKLERVREKLHTDLEQKNKELEQVLYITSHDLRSPLVNIEGFSKELTYSLDKLMNEIKSHDDRSTLNDNITSIVKEDISESLKYIHSSVRKMDSLLNGLLEVARFGKLKLEKEQLNMNDMMSDIHNTIEFQLNEAKAELVISKLPPCIGDKAQLNQVFSNLIDNSLKYLNPNHPGIIKMSGLKENGFSTYCVEDNGIGIAPEHQSKIFHIFHQLDPAHTTGEGLGLTIVQKIIENHSGKIWVESELGKGSKFYISLPSSD